MLRYRFAQQLTDGHFEEAIAGALAAHARKEILDPDLQFVVGIVRGAEQMKARQQAAESKVASEVTPVNLSLMRAPASGTA
jgi:hypothetical protein